MQIDFHYYATYCAAYLAGFSHEECMEICSSAQFTDCCSVTLLSGIGAPLSAATTQLQLEIMDAKADILSLQDITRIWASFHFLPRDLSADVPGGSGTYKNKYRLICGPDSDLLAATVELAKDKSLQAAGIAMHVLADTWAHRYFAGTPSMVINNTDYDFFELIPEGDSYTERRVTFRHNPSAEDDLDQSIYTNTVNQFSENSVMCLPAGLQFYPLPVPAGLGGLRGGRKGQPIGVLQCVLPDDLRDAVPAGRSPHLREGRLRH